MPRLAAGGILTSRVGDRATQVSYAPQEVVGWVPETVALPHISEVQVHAFSADLWDSVKVCRKTTRGRFVMPRGHVASDLVAIVLRPPDHEDGHFGSEHVVHRGCRGSVNVLPAGMPYTYACEGARETLHLSIAGTHDASDDESSGTRALELRPLFAAADPLIVSIGSALLSEATAEPRDRLYGESMAAALRAHLVRRYGAAHLAVPSPSSSMTTPQVQRVLDFIEAHLAQNLGLGEMAKVAGMSRTRFLAGFKRATGMSPHKYLIGRRVERAKVLLADPDLSLHEVAARLGYTEQTSFARVFRRITQITPGAYRTLYRR